MNLIQLIVEEVMINSFEKKIFIVVKKFWYGKNITGLLEDLFEYYFLNTVVNVSFFSDLNTSVSTTLK